ncbi:Os02g0207500, partial [Oryza sativa Japonica Group]|uniref:Uncharacterized protein n=2 Tax=Oryza TaxID=4527 RepID=A0A0E0NBF4_ORYRU
MLDPWRQIFTRWLEFSSCIKDVSTSHSWRTESVCLLASYVAHRVSFAFFTNKIHLVVVFGVAMVFVLISLKNNSRNLKWCC